MRFLFLGAGAIGTYIGGSLAASGHEVGFLDQPRTASVLAAQGLKLHTDGGTRVVSDLTVFTDAATALDAAAWDVAVCAVKSFDTPGLIDGLVSTGREVPPVLSLQNGVDNELVIAERLGERRVIAGTVTTAIARAGVGEVVEETRRGVGVALGNPISHPLVTALDGAGLRARAYRHAGSMKWSKLLTNLQGNAASAILDLPVGALMADPRLYRLEMESMRECLRVMRALGSPPVDLPGTPVRALALAVERLPHRLVQPILARMLGGSRGDKMPSFHIDLHSGRGSSEVAWVNGAVVRHGEAVGVPTPVNRLLTRTLQALTDGTEDVARYRHHPEALLSQL